MNSSHSTFISFDEQMKTKSQWQPSPTAGHTEIQVTSPPVSPCCFINSFNRAQSQNLPLSSHVTSFWRIQTEERSESWTSAFIRFSNADAMWPVGSWPYCLPYHYLLKLWATVSSSSFKLLVGCCDTAEQESNHYSGWWHAVITVALKLRTTVSVIYVDNPLKYQKPNTLLVVGGTHL